MQINANALPSYCCVRRCAFRFFVLAEPLPGAALAIGGLPLGGIGGVFGAARAPVQGAGGNPELEAVLEPALGREPEDRSDSRWEYLQRSPLRQPFFVQKKLQGNRDLCSLFTHHSCIAR